MTDYDVWNSEIKGEKPLGQWNPKNPSLKTESKTTISIPCDIIINRISFSK